MELFIQIRNGFPFEHPIFEDNFRQAFPNVDTDNLPESFAKFVRIPVPEMGVYEIYEGVTYEWIDEIIKDVHHIRSMSEEEKLQKQSEVKEQWAQNPGWTSWIFIEDTCSFVPPIPRPNDGAHYFWDEPTISWKLLP